MILSWLLFAAFISLGSLQAIPQAIPQDIISKTTIPANPPNTPIITSVPYGAKLVSVSVIAISCPNCLSTVQFSDENNDIFLRVQSFVGPSPSYSQNPVEGSTIFPLYNYPVPAKTYLSMISIYNNINVTCYIHYVY